MSIQSELDKRIQPRNLLTHPFYQAWEAGELPVAALADYAKNYGAFITLLPQAWETLGDAETADEEREHLSLWSDFAASLGTQVSDVEHATVSQLAEQAIALFGSEAAAMGALYAFEAQQPATAASKLDGLRKHYDLPEQAGVYFEEHSHNQHEAAKLLAQIATLPEGEQSKAYEACGQMAEILWQGLTDVYDRHCAD